MFVEMIVIQNYQEPLYLCKIPFINLLLKKYCSDSTPGEKIYNNIRRI